VLFRRSPARSGDDAEAIRPTRFNVSRLRQAVRVLTGAEAEGTGSAPLELMMTDVLGWTCSFLLVLTISKQVYTQWKSRSTAGVSKWLFIGQMLASAGFTVYSVLVHSWVFVVTNGMMCILAVTGLAILLHHRRKERAPYSRASFGFLGSPTPQRSSLR
jgi:uncharacterized protein with PQ loop repeat